MQVEYLKFAFIPLIQDELDQVTMHWNLHKIRPSSNDESSSGRPDILYFLPELYQNSKRGQHVVLDEIEEIQEMVNQHPNRSDERRTDFAKLARLIMEDERLSTPRTANEALDLYISLASSINDRG